MIPESVKRMATAPAANKRYQEETLPAWQKATEAAKAAGTAVPKKPPVPVASWNQPAWLFNGMISPLIPFGIKGVILPQYCSVSGAQEEG